MAGREKICRHAGPLAHLADENDCCAGMQVVEARLDLIHGDVDGAGNVACGELGGRANVDQLRVGRRFGTEVCDRKGWVQDCSST